MTAPRTMRPGSIYQLPTGRYAYVAIGLEGLTAVEAATHVAEVRSAMMAAGLAGNPDFAIGAPAPAQAPPPAALPPLPPKTDWAATAVAPVGEPPRAVSPAASQISTRGYGAGGDPVTAKQLSCIRVRAKRPENEAIVADYLAAVELSTIDNLSKRQASTLIDSLSN